MANSKDERGLVLLALFVLIVIGAIIAGLLFVIQKQRAANGQGTQIKIEGTINL